MGDISRSSHARSAARAQYSHSGKHHHSHHHHHHHHRHHRRKRWPYVVGVVAAVLVVAIGVSGFMLFNSARTLKSQASSVKADISAIQSSLTSADSSQIANKAQNMQKTVSNMETELDGPLWTAAQFVPVLGEDVRNAKQIVNVLDDVTQAVLVPLPGVLEQAPLADLVREDHSVDVGKLDALLSFAQQSAPAMSKAATTLKAIPSFHLDQLNDAVGPAKDKLIAIDSMVQGVATIAPTANSMLGANGDRNYLIVAQNSSEIRSLGGFPGSIGTASVVDGKISLSEFRSVWKDFPLTIPEGLEPTEQELRMFCYGDVAFWKPCDTGVNPDFPRSAEIWATAFEQNGGDHSDGVIAMTPSVVQSVLKAVGPVTLSDGTVLDGTNATRVLEHDLYDKYFNDPDMRAAAGTKTDELFAETAELALDKLFENFSSSTLISLGESLGQAVSDRELMVWMENDAEQQVVSNLKADGALASSDASSRLGVFYCSLYASKMGWFIDADTTIKSKISGPNGSTIYSVSTRLDNIVTQDEADEYAVYIVGGRAGLEVYGLYLYAPAGGKITDIKSSDNLQFVEDNHCGRQVFYVLGGELPVGGSPCTITYQVEVPAGAGELTIEDTPTLTQYR